MRIKQSQNRFSRTLFLSLVLVSSVLNTSSVHAFMTVGESAELVNPNQYRLFFEPQLRTSDGSGFNGTFAVDKLVTDESSVRVLAGAGDTDLYAGASYKWIPFPDTDKQPGLGARAGANIGKKGSDNFFVTRLEPLVSKKIVSTSGTFIPYGSIPWMMTNYQSKSTSSFQLTFGTEFINPTIPQWTFGGEMGFNAKDSFSYISGFATIYLDDLKKK